MRCLAPPNGTEIRVQYANGARKDVDTIGAVTFDNLWLALVMREAVGGCVWSEEGAHLAINFSVII